MKYSIIIPTHNASKYLPTCIDTVINQDYDDYELIISDDHSTDGTKEYLNNIVHKNIKVIHQEKRLSVVEHFEESLKHASGDWIMFLGSDDGLQSYFFDLADFLTIKADEKKIRAIMSSRAYYFWDGCESLYGDEGIIYRARKEFKILNSKKETLLALFGFQPYFELPEMYMTSLFNKSLITEARKLQKGKVFTTMPPDANLGAIAMSLENNYLKSFIPLGWVGTTSSVISPSLVLPDDGVLVDGIAYNKEAGNYGIGETSLYFWNALLRTNKLKSNEFNKLLINKFIKTIIFAGVLSNIRKKNYKDKDIKLEFTNSAILENNLNKSLVIVLSKMLTPLHLIYKYVKGGFNILKSVFYPSYQLKIKKSTFRNVELLEESLKIGEKIKKMINNKKCK
jgi:glycosyltransferase involved in cell wall biosynthesis